MIQVIANGKVLMAQCSSSPLHIGRVNACSVLTFETRTRYANLIIRRIKHTDLQHLLKEQYVGERIALLRQHPLQMPHRHHNRMNLIHTNHQPLPQRLLRPGTASDLRRPAPVHAPRAGEPAGRRRRRRRRRYQLQIERRTHTLDPLVLVLPHQPLHALLQLPEVVENLQPAPDLSLVQPLQTPVQHPRPLGPDAGADLGEPGELLVDDGDPVEAAFCGDSEDLAVELRGLGEVELLGGTLGDEVAELAGEAEEADGGVEEDGSGVEVGELGGEEAEGAVGVGEVEAEAEEGGAEGGEGGAEEGEGGVGVGEGGEVGEEVGVAGQHLRPDLGVEEPDRVLEVLRPGRGGAGRERVGGEAGRREVRRQEGRQDRVAGDVFERGGRCDGLGGRGAVFEGGEAVEGRRGRGGGHFFPASVSWQWRVVGRDESAGGVNGPSLMGLDCWAWLNGLSKKTFYFFG